MCKKFIIYEEWGDCQDATLLPKFQVVKGGCFVVGSFPAHKENFFYNLLEEGKDSEEVKD